MNKTEIQDTLLKNHCTFISFINDLSADEFSASRNQKWTPGQQLEHIYLSVKPVRQALSLPKFLLKQIWGKSNRQGRTYQDLVKKYVLQLENGGRATGRFIPKLVPVQKRKPLSNSLQYEVTLLGSKLSNFSEEELDQYILPHPLLGKLTIREMLFFTIYHVEHHETLTKNNLV